MTAVFECPWCGNAISEPCDPEDDIWEEGGYGIECPECGMYFNVKTEDIVRFDVDMPAW